MSSPLSHVMLVISLLCLGSALAGDRPNLEATIEYEWNQLDYVYRSTGIKAKYLQDPEFFIPENALASGIASYGGYIYVLIPRIKSDKGVPWVLTRLPKSHYSTQHHHALYPYPSWAPDTVGDCKELQNPLAMEVDHNTGMLYVVDTGRAGLLSNNQSHSCPAKIAVYDLKNNRLASTHILPDSVVSRNMSVLKSIVLDYTVPHSDKVKFAYIADAGMNQLIVYDFLQDQTYSFTHPSMYKHDSENITINGEKVHIDLGLSGLALTPDFNYLYFSSMWSNQLFQVPTWPLRHKGMELDSFIRDVGHKVSNSDDMVHGKDSLYYGALIRDAIFRWEKRHDMMTENVPEDQVHLTSQTQLVQNWESLQWPDSLCLDNYGDLWFTSSRNHLFVDDKLDFTPTAGFNFRIFKLKVDDYSYLYDRVPQTPVVG